MLASLFVGGFSHEEHAHDEAGMNSLANPARWRVSLNPRKVAGYKVRRNENRLTRLTSPIGGDLRVVLCSPPHSTAFLPYYRGEIR